MNLAADIGDHAGVELYDICGTGPEDLVAGGWTPGFCFVQFNGFQWSTIQVEGCDGPSPIGAICTTKDSSTLWAAPWLFPDAGEWDVYRRQSDVWSAAPQPTWWLSSYRIGYGGEDRPLSCLRDGGVAALIHDFETGSAWLSIFDGTDWSVLVDFDINADGMPYTVFGTSATEVIVFFYPSFLGGILVSESSVFPLVLPEFGVTGDTGNGFGVASIAGDGEHGFFAVGYWKKSVELEGSGFVWHSDDLQTWEEMEGVPHVDSTNYSEGFWDVCLNDDGTVYVVGTRGDSPNPGCAPRPVVLTYDGLDWVEEDIPSIPDALPGYENCGVFHGVWCDGGHVFAAGYASNDGSAVSSLGVLHYTPPEDL